MIAQLLPDMLGGIVPWLLCLGATVWLCNEGIKLINTARGKPAHPPNEQLAEADAGLSARVTRTENSIRTIYLKLEDMKDTFATELRDQTQEIIASGDRRQESINKQFQEISATLARLDERSKHS